MVFARQQVQSRKQKSDWIAEACSQEAEVLRSVRVGARLFSTTEAEEVFISKQSVEAGVGLATLAHEASKRNDGVLGASHLAVFVNLQLRKVLT